MRYVGLNGGAMIAMCIHKLSPTYIIVCFCYDVSFYDVLYYVESV